MTARLRSIVANAGMSMIWPGRSVADRLAARCLMAMSVGIAGVASAQAQRLLNAPLPVTGDWTAPRNPTSDEAPTPRVRAVAVMVPLPPRRPLGLLGGKERPSSSDPRAPGEDCLAELRATGAHFDSVESPTTSNPACLIDTPIRLVSLSSREGGTAPLSLSDRPVVACRLALAFDAWTKAVAPGLAASRGAPLVTLTTGPGWECRTRNRQSGAPLSNHANGLALDVNTFGFANKARLSVSGGAGDPAFRAVREAACTFFTTVLGPGSDGFHEGHLHVDVVARGQGRFGKYCH